MSTSEMSTCSTSLNKNDFFKTIIYNSLSIILFVCVLMCIASLFSSPPESDQWTTHQTTTVRCKTKEGFRNLAAGFQPGLGQNVDYRGYQRVQLNPPEENEHSILTGEVFRQHVVNDKQPSLRFRVVAHLQPVGVAPFAKEIPKDAHYKVVLANDQGNTIELGPLVNMRNGNFEMVTHSSQLPDLYDFKHIHIQYTDTTNTVTILEGRFA
jgi:hypothetical protein